MVQAIYACLHRFYQAWPRPVSLHNFNFFYINDMRLWDICPIGRFQEGPYTTREVQGLCSVHKWRKPFSLQVSVLFFCLGCSVLMMDPPTLAALQIFQEERHASQMGIGKSKEGFSLYGIMQKCISQMVRFSVPYTIGTSIF